LSPELSEFEARAKLTDLRASATEVKLHAHVLRSSNPMKQAALEKIQKEIDSILESIEVLET